MKIKKIYIVLLVGLLIFFVVMFLLFGLNNLKKEKYSTTIIVGNDTIWSLNKKKWTNTFSSHDEFNWKKFNVYTNNEKLGNYYLWYSDKWYLFDNEKNAINYDGDLIAYKSNIKIPIYNFSEENISDYTYVNKILRDNNITSDDYTSNYKITFDYDNDGIIEDFYVVSNAFSFDNPSKIFSIVFMVKDDVIYPIYNDIQKNTSLNGCKPYFNAFLDIDNDNKYEFILSCAKYSVSKTTKMLYTFKDKKFKIIISN